MKAYMTSMATSALVAFLVGCGGSDGADVAVQDSLGRDLSLAPADTSIELNDVAAADPSVQPPAPNPAPPPARSASRSDPPPAAPPAAPTPAPAPPPATRTASGSLAAGTTLTLAAVDSFSTQTHKAGQIVTARVPADVKDSRGRTLIPAGAIVSLTISQLDVSENVNDAGKLELRATSVSFGGETHELVGVSTDVEHVLKGRGVKAGDAAKVGVGAAAGAVVGRVLSGKKKGAVVGGVIGAAAGAAAAANSYDRDVIVASGATIVLTLSEALEIE